MRQPVNQREIVELVRAATTAHPNDLNGQLALLNRAFICACKSAGVPVYVAIRETQGAWESQQPLLASVPILGDKAS